MSNKNRNVADFAQKFTTLTETDKNNFSRIVSKFYSDTFILKETKSDKDDYYFIRDNEDMFTNYFLLTDYELVNDQFNGVIYIKTLANRNRARLSKFDTAILLILRRLYYMKKKEVSQFDNLLITLDDIMSELQTSQIYSEEKKVTHYKDTLYKLRKYKIINFQGDRIDGNLPIQILSSVLVVIPQNSLEEILVKLKGLAKESDSAEDINEEINED